MNKMLTGVLVGSAVLAAGCAAVAGGTRHQAAHQASPTAVPSTVPTGTPPQSPPQSPGRGGLADLRQAAQAALAAVPGATLTSIESEENGRLWEVQVTGRDGAVHQLDVEAGKVVMGPTKEEDDDEDKTRHRERVAAAKLDYLQATEKIAATVPEGRITELHLDEESGRTVWESDVLTPDGTKREVVVDATTGEITKNGATS